MIGLDGLETTIVRAMLDAGELPNLARLRSSGGHAAVATTTPAQTPVAWSTFATGTNPGGHGIFDFIRRDPRTYLPDLAFNRYESRGPFLPPRAVNLRRGQPVWEVLSRAGVESTVIRCPVTFPPDEIHGQVLSGMGVPDLRGGLGTPSFYTTCPGAAPRESENLPRLQPRGDGTIDTVVIGPRHPRQRTDLTCEITLVPRPESRSLVVRSAGVPGELTVGQGKWSDWLRVKFKVGLLQSVSGLVRFHLVRLEPELELYASPVNFDVEAPPFPLSHPADYARELAQEVGLFHSTGMVEDHTGLNNERISENAFLDQCETAWREREAMMLHGLERLQEGLLFCLFDTPDRVQHLFWRFREPDHPANRGRTARPEFARVIEEQYRRGDQVVGQALEFADDETLLVVMSDHGFGSFRRGANLNTILHDLGLLALRDGLKPGPEAGDLLKRVDWQRTRAYAIGLSGIYLNLRGREAEGVVEPDQAHDLEAALCRALSGLVDPETGATAIRRVRPSRSAFSGPFTGEAPELLVDFAPGYRVSWSSSMGGTPAGRFEDNTKKWSGDHIVDPSLVPGVLFMNRPFRAEAPALVDLAPTILEALGVPGGPSLEGRSLVS